MHAELASLARLALWPGDGKQPEYLEDRLLAASPVELPVIWGILRKHDQGTDKRLRQLLEDPKADPDRRFRAACALANSDAAQVENRWDTVAPFLTDRFVTAVIKNPSDYSHGEDGSSSAATSNQRKALMLHSD